jgi:hypothetical protein
MNESLPRERSECSGHEQRGVGLFRAQPEGLGLFFRPAALSLVDAEQLYLARSALLDDKTDPAKPIGFVLAGPSETD